MPTIEITVDDSQAQALYERALVALDPRKLHKQMAESGAMLTREHLREVSASRDSGSRFYENHAAGVYAEADDVSAMVNIPPAFNKGDTKQRGNPLAAHYWGYDFTQANLDGTSFNGKQVTHYTIPTAVAKGMRAGQFGDELKPMIRMIGGRPQVIALALREYFSTAKQKALAGRMTGKQAKRIRGFQKKVLGGFKETVMFWLIKGFTLKEDKSVLPAEDEYRESCVDSLTAILGRLEFRE